jgi:hypothetical protein
MELALKMVVARIIELNNSGSWNGVSGGPGRWHMGTPRLATSAGQVANWGAIPMLRREFRDSLHPKSARRLVQLSVHRLPRRLWLIGRGDGLSDEGSIVVM